MPRNQHVPLLTLEYTIVGQERIVRIDARLRAWRKINDYMQENSIADELTGIVGTSLEIDISDPEKRRPASCINEGDLTCQRHGGEGCSTTVYRHNDKLYLAAWMELDTAMDVMQAIKALSEPALSR